MGYESSLFLATPSDIERIFVKWKPAIFPPRVVEALNPFTNEMTTVTVEVEEYDEDEDVDGAVSWEQISALGGPSLNQSVSASLLRSLANTLGLGEEALRRALSEPPGSGVAVYVLDATFVSRLAGKDVLPALVSLGLSKKKAQDAAGGLAALATAANEKPARVYLVEET